MPGISLQDLKIADAIAEEKKTLALESAGKEEV